MNKEDLKPGDIIVKNDRYLNKIISIENNGYNIIKYFIDLQYNYFTNYVQKVQIGNTIRLATEKEKHWLNECIKANKFIEEREALRSFIPEKWCIKNTNRCLRGLLYKYNLNGDSINSYYFMINNKMIVHYDLPRSHTEISFEQFEKYILKLDVVETKEIIDKTVSIKSIKIELLKHYEKEDVNEIINIINKIK